MDYEKKYNEAMERAKSLVRTKEIDIADLRFIFPELAELDDERVGRLLYCIVRENTAVKAVLEANGVAVDRALEYLESHKGKNYVHENCMTAKFHKPEDGVKYDMYFEDAQAYIEKRGFDVPWNDGDVFVDKDYLVQTVANIIRWADENGSECSDGLEAEKPCHTVEDWMEHIKNADQLTKDIFSNGPYNVLYDALNHPYRDCYDAIKEFGELCYQTARQDIMKEAVEGIAVINANAKDDGFGYVRSDYVSDDVLRGLGNFKLIIVKEEKDGTE